MKLVDVIDRTTFFPVEKKVLCFGESFAKYIDVSILPIPDQSSNRIIMKNIAVAATGYVGHDRVGTYNAENV